MRRKCNDKLVVDGHDIELCNERVTGKPAPKDIHDIDGHDAEVGDGQIAQRCVRHIYPGGARLVVVGSAQMHP